MKVTKAAAATALAGLVLLGTAGSASALTLDLSGIVGGLVNDTTRTVDGLLGGTPELPAAVPAAPGIPGASVGTDGISIQVGDILSVEIGTNAPSAPGLPHVDPAVPLPSLPVNPGMPNIPGLPTVPGLPGTDGLPQLPVSVPTASIPAMPDAAQAFTLIDFQRDEVMGMAMSIQSNPAGAVETASTFAQRTAGFAVDFAGLASVRLMVASAYEAATSAVSSATP